MDLNKIIDEFYEENIQVSKYSGYDGCEEEIEELKVTEEKFKENLKKLIGRFTR